MCSAEIKEDGMTTNFTNAIGVSPAWQAVITAAVRVAVTEATVFLQGESGTGKEVVARLVHQLSPRKSGPLVAINCAALPEPLYESELFGYERGAFTGAQQSKAGQIELAARGVLFLDEVTELSQASQVKLLRFVQEREFRRLGVTRLQKADVRIIAASNRDLNEAVDEGSFRLDLFYRLQVFDIQLPPLRERVGDIGAARGVLSFRDRSQHGGASAPSAGRCSRGLAWLRLARKCPRAAERARTRGHPQ
jgi:transcriptional regulator with PAS, ATPase and Fis domain